MLVLHPLFFYSVRAYTFRTSVQHLCCSFAKNSHICPDRSTDTLAHVITKLASTKAHRVYVVENGKATSVISLTDLLRHIYTNPDFADW